MFVYNGSTDGPAELIPKLAQSERRIRPYPLHRPPRAVVGDGRRRARLNPPVIAVIDADLQHDEIIVPDLYRDQG